MIECEDSTAPSAAPCSMSLCPKVSVRHDDRYLEKFAHSHYFAHSQLIEFSNGLRQMLALATTVKGDKFHFRQILQCNARID